MKKGLKVLTVLLFFLLGIIIMSVEVQSQNLPLLDYVGDFNYCDGAGGGNNAAWCKGGSSQDPYSLIFSNFNITGGNYSDGSYFSEGEDLVTGAWFEIGNLYNNNYPNNLVFGDSQGSTGPVTLKLTDGTHDFFNATMENFIISEFFAQTRTNPGYNLDNVTSVSYGTGFSSRYIDELKSTTDPLNLFMNFTFNSGTQGNGFSFSDDADGTISGKLGAGALSVVPEPVSSILFITGGAALAFRRFRKKRTQVTTA